MDEEVMWVDFDGNEYTASDIDDQRLINIIGFVCRGGGFVSMRTAEVTANLFVEAFKRGLNQDKRLVQTVITS